VTEKPAALHSEKKNNFYLISTTNMEWEKSKQLEMERRFNQMRNGSIDRGRDPLELRVCGFNYKTKRIYYIIVY
jgi:hypothetical protein